MGTRCGALQHRYYVLQQSQAEVAAAAQIRTPAVLMRYLDQQRRACENVFLLYCATLQHWSMLLLWHTKLH